MSWLEGSRARLRLLFGRRATESRMDREFRFHVDMETDRLMREKGLDDKAAYAIASIGVDFRVGEAVNLNQMVYGMIPKALFVKERQTTYWFKP